jgi:serine/threonine protein kinase
MRVKLAERIERPVKRVCTVCQRISPDGNLWCQEPDCPSGDLPVIFDYGDWLGDIQVIRLLRVLRTSAIYEAERWEEMVLLKVAHNNCQDQLRREARALVELAQIKQHPMLPVLLPAYRQADTRQRPYGKTVFRDETKYYEVFAHVKGEFLRDMLLKNPQPWYQHAVWMTISLADAIAFMNLKAKKLHLNLSPDSIFVRTDKEGIPRPVLIDLGLLGEQQVIDPAWVRRFGVAAYTPPELIAPNGAATYAADVYGLGLVLYEMLAGHPAFRFQQRKEEDIRQVVVKGLPEPLNRTDLAEDIQAIVNQAVDRQPARRQQDVVSFARLLRKRFGEVPAERKRSYNRRIAAVVVVIALVCVVTIILLALIG